MPAKKPTDWTPHPKMVATGTAGALGVIIVWGLSTLAHVDLPPDVAAALVVVLSFGAGYLKKP